MNSKLYLLILLLVTQFCFEANAKNLDNNDKIMHYFTAYADTGESHEKTATDFDISGWIGSERNRLWVRGEKKNYGDYEKRFEAQALYSRNVVKNWDAQIGIVHDFSTDFTSKNVNYLTLAIEGFVIHSFETTVQILLSNKGNYSTRLKQEIDILLTEKLIVQPYFQTEIFAQNVEELEERSGITDFEIGIATRYEMSENIAPYVAFRYNKKTFGTASLAKELGNKIDTAVAVAGIRFKF
jgi:copper resistance protein B